MAQRSIWGSSAPPGTYTFYTDGSPGIWTGNGFYRVASGTPVQSVVGFKLWVTAAMRAATTQVTARIFTSGQYNAGNPDTGQFDSPHETKTFTLAGTDGWQTFLFDTALPTPDLGLRVYIMVQYTQQPAGYLHSGTITATPIAAEGGFAFALGSGSEYRSVYRLGTANLAIGNNNPVYGIDIVFDDVASGDTTPPSAPTGLNTTSVTHNSATLNWTASTDDVGVTSYEITVNGSVHGTVGNVTTYQINSLSPETAYTVTVRARDAAGNWSSASSSTGFTTDEGPPGATVITTYSGTPTSSHVIPLTGAVTGRDTILVLAVAATPTVPAPWTTINTQLITGGSGYVNIYRLDESETVPASVTVSLNGPRAMAALVFQDDVDEATIYANLATASGPASSVLWGTGLHTFSARDAAFAVFGGVANSMGAAAITSYDDGFASFGGPNRASSGNGTEDAFLRLGTKNTVTKANAGVSGTGTALTPMNGAAGMLAYNRSVAPTDTEPPTVPTGLAVNTVTSFGATATWNVSTDNVGVTGYRLWLDGVIHDTATTNTKTITGLIPDTTYELQVQARDAVGNWSALSSAVEFTTATTGPRTIPEENAMAGEDPGQVTISGVGDATNLGFARPFSQDTGQVVNFACHGSGTILDIYRIGWYGGAGWHRVARLTNTATSQPNPLTIAGSNGGVECTNWSNTATWNIPANATPGLYVGVYRNAAANNASYIPFVVKNDARPADIIYKTSDATWALAYNYYGTPAAPLTGKSLYGSGGPLGGISDRCHAVSYERPIVTRGGVSQTYWLNAEAPMIRWLERMGYNVKYVSCRDVDLDPSCLDGASVIISNGHDEYWSQDMRDAHENARDSGQHLIFASGNEVFWRTRFENERMWCFKDTMPGPGGHVAGIALDPVSWTGTWKDTRPAAASIRAPENTITGTDFRMNGVIDFDASATAADPWASHPVWRNTTIAPGGNGSTISLPRVIGFEADRIRPTQPSLSVRTLLSKLQNIDGRFADDNGENYSGNGSLDPWGIVSQRYPSGALVVGLGTCQWSWVLDGTHDRTNTTPQLGGQQFTYNLLRDLDADAATPHTGIVTSAPQSLDAYGGIPFVGDIAQTLPALTQSAVGGQIEEITGDIVQVLPALTQAAVGETDIPVFSGDIGQVLPALTQEATGIAPIVVRQGPIVQVLPALTQAMDGDFVPVAGVVGDIVQSLPALGQAATGETDVPVFAGDAAQTLPRLGQAATGSFFPPPPPPTIGDINQVLPALTQIAAGQTDWTFDGDITQTLPSLRTAAIGSFTPVPVEGGDPMAWVNWLSPAVYSAVVTGCPDEAFTVPTDLDYTVQLAVLEASAILTRLTAFLIHPAGEATEDFKAQPQVHRLRPNYTPITEVLQVWRISLEGCVADEVTDRGWCLIGQNIYFTKYRATAATWYRGLSCRPYGDEVIRVRYSFGNTVTGAARRAVLDLAHQLWLSCNPNAGDCQLPERVTSVNREGLSYTIIDPQAFLDMGRTGLPRVDLWLAAVNPSKARRPSGVYTPDSPPPVNRQFLGRP